MFCFVFKHLLSVSIASPICQEGQSEKKPSWFLSSWFLLVFPDFWQFFFCCQELHSAPPLHPTVYYYSFHLEKERVKDFCLKRLTHLPTTPPLPSPLPLISHPPPHWLHHWLLQENAIPSFLQHKMFVWENKNLFWVLAMLQSVQQNEMHN